MNEIEEIRKYITVAQRALDLARHQIDLLDSKAVVGQFLQEQPVKVQSVLPTTKVVNPVPQEQHEYEELRKKHVNALMGIDCWPEAVPASAKDADSIESKVKTTRLTLDAIIDQKSIAGLNFLDFGCGEGWFADLILKRGVAQSTGYDIVPSPRWEQFRSGVQFTANPVDLHASSYDVILLHDVLDHCDNPIGVMKQVKHLLKPNGTVYVRCHPWPAKHATHLWKQGINKAYLHLFLTWHEIKELIGTDPIFTRIEIDPLTAYHHWFEEFQIMKERPHKGEPLNDFFKVEDFKNLIMNEQQIPPDKMEDFMKLMEISMIDYVLKPK